jgi:DNA-binding transcriptional regulator of glucitol operon
VLRRLRFALSPGWLVLHVITLAMVVVMVLLGRWQLDVSNAKHFNLQNFGYALQWWAFSVFAVAMWTRIMLDHGGRAPRPQVGVPAGPDCSPQAETAGRADQSVAYRRYVMRQSAAAPAPATDAEHAAYNDYLARLDANSSANRGAEGTTP